MGRRRCEGHPNRLECCVDDEGMYQARRGVGAGPRLVHKGPKVECDPMMGKEVCSEDGLLDVGDQEYPTKGGRRREKL